MIWTLLIAAILIASVAVLILVDEYDCCGLYAASVLTAITSGIILVCMIGCIIAEHTSVDQKVAALEAERDAIVYQMENQLYLGDALGSFNSKIISWRYTHDNPWTSWFQGAYIFEVDPIELK